MSDLGNLEKIPTIYGHFYSLKDDLITYQLKKFSAHTRNELAMLQSFIMDGDNIIDVGAHIGSFAIPFAKFNKGKGKIFSFEADLENYQLLCRNINVNCLNHIIIPTHAIVSDTKRKFEKITPCEDNTGTYSFLPVSINDGNCKLDVNVINLDDWYENNEQKTVIDLIKIDVEGAELAVLLSCERIIKKYSPILYIEINQKALARFSCTSDKIESFLNSSGYQFFKNIGHRNSDNDIFTISRLNTIEEGGDFFDLLAIHPASYKYPASLIDFETERDTDMKMFSKKRGIASKFVSNLQMIRRFIWP